MKQTVTESMFIDSFTGGYKDNFSYEGKKALFAYLEDMEDSGCFGENELELDPVGLCCEFTEYEDWDSLLENYSDYCKDSISDNTSYIEFSGGVIIQNF